jgi:hypothetical protein
MILANQNIAHSNTSVRSEKISWLLANHLAPLPVAPAQDSYKYHKVVRASGNRGEHCPLNSDRTPIPIYTGKNPSYLDEAEKPHLINHHVYQKRLPSKKELKRWFANRANGIGTLGSDRVCWIDLDVKQFASQKESDRAFDLLLERQPLLRETLIEKTHSGGYRIGVRVKNPSEFTNFCLEPGGAHVGECLGAGRFTVLAPTIGVSGNAYESINSPEQLVEIEQIDFIYPTKEKKEAAKPLPTKNNVTRKTDLIPGALALEQLGHPDSQKVLAGEDIKGDRSDSLTTAIAEWAGWSNWCSENGVAISGSVEELAQTAGERLGIDGDRLGRILKSIDLDSCHPAAVYRGDDSSCWRKIRRIDRVSYETRCPDSIKKEIDAIISSNQGGNGNGNGTDISRGRGDLAPRVLNNSRGGNEDGYPQERNNWNAPESWNGEIGYWETRKRQKIAPDTGEVLKESETVRQFQPKCNFSLGIERELSDNEGGGFLLRIKRSVDARSKRIIIRSLETITTRDFTAALTRTYGKEMVCTLKNDQLGALLQTKLVEYRDRGGETYILADRIGQQETGEWIFKNSQLTRAGSPTDEEKSKIVFNPNLGSEDKISSPTIAAPDTNALSRLISAAHRFHGESQIDAAIFTLGWAAACLHFQEIIKAEKHFPLLNLYGDPGSAKTVMAESALSLAGWLDGEGQFRKITESALYEHLKLCGSLPLCFDDPDKGPWLDGLIQGLYNAKPRVVRGNEQTPHTSLLLTTNHLVGDNKPATLSRLIAIATFASSDGDSTAWDELLLAQQGASSALPQLLALGYPAQEIRHLAKQLRQYLPHAHQRIGDSIALVLWYAMAICRLSGFDEGRLKHFAIAHLCKQANDADSASNSLSDFLDKLSALHAQSLVGEWDCRLITTREGFEALALSMPSVWQKVEKIYNPPYSRRVIESQISAAGGILKSVQKFYRSDDEVKAYRRALITGGNQGDNYVAPTPPDELTRKCVLLPTHLVKDFLSAWKDETVPVTSELPEVTSELPQKSNSSNPHQAMDSTISTTSSYLFEKEKNKWEDTVECFNHVETQNLQQTSSNSQERVTKVTQEEKTRSTLDGANNTDSYQIIGNSKVTNSQFEVTEPPENTEASSEENLQPTLSEIQALLLACKSLNELKALKKKHRQKVREAYKAMPIEQQLIVDGISAATVDAKVFKYTGKELVKGGQRLVSGALVYLDPKSASRPKSGSASVWLLKGLKCGWNKAVEVSRDCLLAVEKAIVPVTDVIDGEQGMLFDS